MANVESRIKSLIAKQFDLAEDKLTAQTSFKDLDADSLDTFELMQELEEEFSIDIPDNDIEKLKNVGDLITYVTGKTNA